ncbi:ESPR domain-containing protein [uncultured Megasphaera sp.]|uniref:ESPR domain-containing protein n=1 Tax=uncultured Megasphaera sp. TaxID=165188 RepID=UPI0025E79446|nr:ESPR domain-containing protein [uncultured Megasphaera sp.]
MNRAYKVIWSKARRCDVIVSELAKGQHRSSSKNKQISTDVHRGDLGKAALAAVVASLLTFGGLAYSPVMAADYNFDSHTSINGSGGYHDPGSSDLDNFSHPDSDLTLDWTNEGKTEGISRGSGVSAIYNTPEVTAKNITIIATQKGNQLELI